MDVLHRWVSVIVKRILGGGGKDRSLERHAWNDLLYSSGNILHSITQRVSSNEYERFKVKMARPESRILLRNVLLVIRNRCKLKGND